MPLVQYCKKCRSEVPLSDHCARCGARLAKSSETLSFEVWHTPVKDWFCWNSWLRIALPVLLLIIAAVLAAELAAGGMEAVKKLLGGSFLPVMAGLFCALLLVGLVLLRLQRYERIHYAIDKLGLHAWTYLEDPTPVQLYARLMTPAMVRQLEEDERALPDKTLIRHQFLPWKQVSRAYLWEENAVLLLYRPVWWQAMSVRCPIEELPAIEKLVQIYVKPGRKKSAKGKRTAHRKKTA